MLAGFVLTATVTFSAPADVTSRLLPKLGRAVGLHLEADRRAGSQVLLLRVADMAPGHLLTLIAETTGGEWERTSDGFKLVLGSGRLEWMRRDENRTRAEWIGDRLADPKTSTVEATGIVESARTVGAPALAQIGLGERIVWSTSPIGQQRSLPSSFGAVVRRAEALWRRQGVENALRFDLPELANGPTLSATALVIARRERDTDRLWVTLTTYDSQGKEAYSATKSFDPPSSPTASTIIDRLTGKVKPFPAPVVDWANQGRWSPSLQSRGMRPDLEEPLALGVGPAVEALAAEANLDIVACLPDAAYQADPDTVKEGLSSLWAKGIGRLGLKSRMDDGVLVLAPSSPFTTVSTRADRGNLRRRIAEAEIEGSLNYRYGRPSELENAHLTSLNYGPFVVELFGSSSYTFAALWDSLSDAQRDQALHGGLPMANVNGTDLRLPASAYDDLAMGAARRLEDEPTSFGVNPRPAVLYASASAVPAGLYQVKDALFPRASWNLAHLAAEIAAPNPNYPARLPGTRFWPSTSTTITFRAESGGIEIRGDFARSVRERSAGYLAPDYFPALRALLPPVRGG